MEATKRQIIHSLIGNIIFISIVLFQIRKNILEHQIDKVYILFIPFAGSFGMIIFLVMRLRKL